MKYPINMKSLLTNQDSMEGFFFCSSNENKWISLWHPLTDLTWMPNSRYSKVQVFTFIRFGHMKKSCFFLSSWISLGHIILRCRGLVGGFTLHTCFPVKNDAFVLLPRICLAPNPSQNQWPANPICFLPGIGAEWKLGIISNIQKRGGTWFLLYWIFNFKMNPYSKMITISNFNPNHFGIFWKSRFFDNDWKIESWGMFFVFQSASEFWPNPRNLWVPC